VAVLHRMFRFATKKQLMAHKAIELMNESKPGKNPKNGARPFKADELAKLRQAAGEDYFMLLLLRWTGLRGSDAVNLKWQDIQFDRGANGEHVGPLSVRINYSLFFLAAAYGLFYLFAKRRAKVSQWVLDGLPPLCGSCW
jgi:integrase